MTGQPAVVLERPDVDWERHKGTGAPKILPPPGVEWRSSSGKTKQRHRYYTRVTTYADAISDQYNLGQWRMRRVALGLGQRPDYVRLASALTDRDDDRDALDELVSKALEAAGPNKADEGTALHALTERIDRGEPLGNPPPELLPDLTAYEVLSGELFVFVQRECRVVCDELECAGTPDGIAHIAEPPPTDWGPRCDCPPDALRVVDTKTGSIRYPAKMSIQLAIYAHSDRYNPATGERMPLGGERPVCPHWGAIVHLPVESGRAAPYWLDLELGWRGAELCGPVREWNKLKADDVLRPFTTVEPVVATAAGTVERGERRLASHNPKAPTAAPAEPVDLTEQLAASLAAQTAALAATFSVPVERIGEPARCDLSDLPVDQCACRVHRPDLAGIGDEGVEVDELTTFDYTGEPGDPGDPSLDVAQIVLDQPPALRRSETTRLLAEEADPITGAILGCLAPSELELLWRAHGSGWSPAHRQLAAERMDYLRAEPGLERARAAMSAGIASAATLDELTALMVAYRDEAFMTRELFAHADRRFWALRGQPARHLKVVE